MKSMNAIAALWPCLAQLNASFVTASVPPEIISMHSRWTPFISAGEKFDYLAFLFSNFFIEYLVKSTLVRSHAKCWEYAMSRLPLISSSPPSSGDMSGFSTPRFGTT